MHMRQIASALAHLFERHNHDVSLEAAIPGRTGADYILPLAAWHEGEWLLVDGDLSAPAAELAVHRLVMACIDTGARGIYCHAGGADGAAQNACLDKVLLWDRSILAQLLGQTQIADAMGEAPPTLPLGFPATPPAETNFHSALPTDAPTTLEPASESALAFAELMPPVPEPEAKAAESVEQILPAAFQAVVAPLTSAPDAQRVLDWEPHPAAVETAGPLQTDAEVSALTPPTESATISEASAPTLDVPSGSNGIFAVKIDLHEAKQRVAERLRGWEQADLVLQPIHLFDYAVEILQQGSLETKSKQGRLEVNGTDRTVRTIPPGLKLAGEAARVPDATITVMEKILRVNEARALQVANEWVSSQHSKTVNVASGGHDDDFALTERRNVAPTSGQVTITPLGLWHRPFWRLWGDNGHIDIDAVDGAVLDEELRRVAESDAMLIE